MFTITLNDIEYKFSFKHQPAVTKSVEDEFIDVPPHTICYVDHCGVISDYYAWLHPNDKYSRETGRKVALAKALKDLFPDDKTTRLEVWMEYFNTLKGKGIKPQKPPTPQKPANDYDPYYNVSWWLDGITGVDKCIIRRVPPKPEPTNYPIPDEFFKELLGCSKPEKYPIPAGYRKLGNDELMQEGDVYLAIDSQPQDFPDIWYGKPAELLAERVTSHTVLRPIETKLIHGNLMRKLEGDEYPQIGDWWGNDENDPIGCWVASIGTTKKTTKEYNPHPVFWRPVDK